MSIEAADQLALERFRRLVMEPWGDIERRLSGRVDERRRRLSQDKQQMLELLEHGMGLLEPLRGERKERLHQCVFVWALKDSGPIVAACRRGWMREHGVDAPAAEWRIMAEHRTAAGRRIDVTIEIEGHARHCVEMKVDSGESADQLSDYWEHTAGVERHAVWKLVFLTPDGRRGETSAPHLPMSWEDVLRMWLPVAIGPSREAAYLAMWLVTLAREVVRVADRGAFDDWGLSHKLKTLDLLERVGGQDD